ncbi:hypothetical protein PATSB16_26370 [Pandoraea thiooxydans]|nr:hypothetical protein PATSB16_26370 [Pandoraea thiooxydans]
MIGGHGRKPLVGCLSRSRMHPNIAIRPRRRGQFRLYFSGRFG